MRGMVETLVVSVVGAGGMEKGVDVCGVGGREGDGHDVIGGGVCGGREVVG